jgi:hypothetical protein
MRIERNAAASLACFEPDLGSTGSFQYRRWARVVRRDVPAASRPHAGETTVATLLV